ncbi:MAG TPA: class I SAM-dependent methyltransferase [Luteimonas sp.]|nr:class I SAM-dependent methyltransferase [Luteimonas sp.]
MPLLPAGSRILELGAGDGWQAAELQRRGFSVTAIDAHAPPGGQRQHFAVAHYDGYSLPYPDNHFDAIYSSNVLEHVGDFERIQSELHRVLRPGGVALHCVPSSTWRLWTSLGHPFYVGRWAIKLLSARKAPQSHHRHGKVLASTRKMSTVTLVKAALWPQRHGEHGSSLGELWLFSRWAWARRFHNSGWRVVAVQRSRLCYTGNELLGLRVGVKTRTLMSRLLGSSTVLYSVVPDVRDDASG